MKNDPIRLAPPSEMDLDLQEQGLLAARHSVKNIQWLIP